ncbi:odorant-binding protein 83g [Musca autumnalis]|uniref:odorant-binding protein 83g n=1 Tax=Musca autumnalis TaxID=221902 RepID=UPI003CF6211D
MKFQVVFLLICGVAWTSAAAKFEVRTPEDALKAHEDCRAEFPSIPDEIYEQYLEYTFPEHKRTKCYVKCWVEKMGIFHERKGYDEKAIYKQFTNNNTKFLSTVQHGLEKCIDHNEAETDFCTFAHRVFSCWLPINRHVVRSVLGTPKAN